jgi:hypothetical protein
MELILQMANQKNITFTLVDCGGDGELTRRLVAGGYDASHFSVISSPSPEKDLEITLSDLMNKVNAIVGIAASYLPGTEKQELRLLVITPAGRTTSTRSYGGAPTDGILWSINTALDALRRALTSINP